MRPGLEETLNGVEGEEVDYILRRVRRTKNV